MEPLCKEGDFILLDKLSYLMFRPRAGDVVVLRHPTESARLILKYITRVKEDGHEFLYWVEGLNKEESSDSRSFGWIPRRMIRGKAVIIEKSKGFKPAISGQRKKMAT